MYTGTFSVQPITSIWIETEKGLTHLLVEFFIRIKNISQWIK